jgi:hypothetical protein
MDSCRAILPGTLRMNANPFLTDLCRTNRQDSRFARAAPEGCGTGMYRMNPEARDGNAYTFM